MNIKSLLTWKLMLLLLLTFQSYKFAKADDSDDDDDDNDENNLFNERFDIPQNPEDPALRAIRDYIDLLCINWNGFYYKFYYDTPLNRRILDTYLRKVSSAYSRVLHYYNDNNDVISRTMREQFMAHIIPQMLDVVGVDEDSPIQNGSAVVELRRGDVLLHFNEDMRRERWGQTQNDRPYDEIVPTDKLRDTIRMRVPYYKGKRKRPTRPYRTWKKNLNPNPDEWHGLNMTEDITWNHLVPFAEINWLLRRYNELWLESNDGNLWHGDLMQMNLEIRLARLVIVRAGFRMGDTSSGMALINFHYYLNRATALNSWPAGNLFIGPRDAIRFPRPNEVGPDRFEMHAARNIMSTEWAEEGRRLTADILDYMARPPEQQNLRDIIELLDRYVRLLQASGSGHLWYASGQGVAPVALAQYDVQEHPLAAQLRQRFERRVAADVRRIEERDIITREYQRLRRLRFPEAQIRIIVEEEKKPGGKIFEEVAPIRKKKLDEMVKAYLSKRKIHQFTFTGPKHSVKWKDLQDLVGCVSPKLDVDAKICGPSILLDASSSPGPSSAGPSSPEISPGAWSVGSDDVFTFDNLKLVEDDSGLGSSGSSGPSSRKPSDTDTDVCGISVQREFVLIDPVSTLSNPPRDIAGLQAVDDAYNDDTVETIQGVIVDGCLRANGTNERRERRDAESCTLEILKEYWKECEKIIKVSASLV